VSTPPTHYNLLICSVIARTECEAFQPIADAAERQSCKEAIACFVETVSPCGSKIHNGMSLKYDEEENKPMPTKTKTPLPFDDAYLEIWKIEQEHSRTRWTITTFFLSISFAILGLSFDIKDNQAAVNILGLSLPDAQRIIGLLIYWFGYILFLQFNRYTNFLRDRLKNMEIQKFVSYSFQSDAREFMYSKLRSTFSATWLLFYFGILYTAIVVLLALST
jgi:hypothetical protein